MGTEEKELFEEAVRVEPCSWNACAGGHQWRPTIALAECGGCGGPTVMVKMENCPVCNEPVERFQLRTDHVARGAGVVKRCRGEQVRGESVDVQFERKHWTVPEGRAEEVTGC